MNSIVCKFCGHAIQFEIGDRIKQCAFCGYCALFSVEGEVSAWGDNTLIDGCFSESGTTGSSGPTESGGTARYYGQSRKKKKIQKHSKSAKKVLGQGYEPRKKHFNWTSRKAH